MGGEEPGGGGPRPNPYRGLAGIRAAPHTAAPGGTLADPNLTLFRGSTCRRTGDGGELLRVQGEPAGGPAPEPVAPGALPPDPPKAAPWLRPFGDSRPLATDRAKTDSAVPIPAGIGASTEPPCGEALHSASAFGLEAQLVAAGVVGLGLGSGLRTPARWLASLASAPSAFGFGLRTSAEATLPDARRAVTTASPCPPQLPAPEARDEGAATVGRQPGEGPPGVARGAAVPKVVGTDRRRTRSCAYCGGSLHGSGRVLLAYDGEVHAQCWELRFESRREEVEAVQRETASVGIVARDLVAQSQYQLPSLAVPPQPLPDPMLGVGLPPARGLTAGGWPGSPPSLGGSGDPMVSIMTVISNAKEARTARQTLPCRRLQASRGPADRPRPPFRGASGAVAARLPGDRRRGSWGSSSAVPGWRSPGRQQPACV
jgi:hypothetical protein